MRPEGVDGRSILEWVWNGEVASLMRLQMPMPGCGRRLCSYIYRGQRRGSVTRTQELTPSIYRGGKTLGRDEEQSAEKDDEGARSSGLLAGGYCGLPATTSTLVSDDPPRQRSITDHAKRITSWEALIGGPNRRTMPV